MNARESLAADRDAENAWNALTGGVMIDPTPEDLAAGALVAIAAELRAARIYANYLEGRQGTRWAAKRKPEPVS